MIGFIRRHPIAAGIAALALLFLLIASFPVIPETKQAVVVRFGNVERIYKRAGLAWRIPFIESVVWIDKRMLDVDMDRQPVLSTDQRRLEVDAFARYRIVDPLRMYITTRSEERLRDSPERRGVMENVRNGLNRVAHQYGAEIIDVRIKKAELPDGTPLESAFERMRTAREQEARSIRAEGAKRAQIIRADADADAAKTYAASFGKDAGFYDFYRAMQSYRTTFLGDGTERPAGSTVILSPQNDYLRAFTEPGR